MSVTTKLDFASKLQAAAALTVLTFIGAIVVGFF
jgi:hypothetical protein